MPETDVASANPIHRLRAALPTGISRLWLRRILLTNLVAQIGIVLTGGIVRLTGSGLGCPTFPECVSGSILPVVHQPQGFHKYIEFGNRMLTTVVTVTALAALIAVWRYVRAGQGGRRLLGFAALPLIGVLAQALIGGISVLTELNPTVVAVHFLVSMALIAVSTLLLLVAVPASTETTDAGLVPELTRWAARALVPTAALALMLGTGVTGSGPHSGDAEDPNRFSFDIPLVTRMHSGSVWLFVLLVVTIVVTLRRADGPADARRWSTALLLVTAAQGVIGYAQYALGVPAPLVAVHMLGASLFVVATTGTTYALRRRRRAFTPEPTPVPTPTSLHA